MGCEVVFIDFTVCYLILIALCFLWSRSRFYPLSNQRCEAAKPCLWGIALLILQLTIWIREWLAKYLLAASSTCFLNTTLRQAWLVPSSCQAPILFTFQSWYPKPIYSLGLSLLLGLKQSVFWIAGCYSEWPSRCWSLAVWYTCGWLGSTAHPALLFSKIFWVAFTVFFATLLR